MQRNMQASGGRRRAGWAAAVAAALLAAGCGGGGGDAAPGSAGGQPLSLVTESAPATLPGVTRLVVAGDSLADVGTFGFKLTVQDAANPAGFPVFAEEVAAAHALPAGCSHFVQDGAGNVVPRGEQTCTNFAVAGARILARGDTAPSVPAQLREASIKLGSRYDPGDLVLVDGGANDASAVAAGYLAATVSRAGMLAFLALLAREVDTGALLATAPGDDSLGRSAALYMEAAADTLVRSIVEDVLERGALRVALLNLPDITRTPRFTGAFARLAAAHGAATAASVQSAVRQAVAAYNARLQLRLAHDPRIVLVDVHAAVDAQLAQAAAYGLSNATDAACPVTGTGGAGLPEWTLPACTSASLDAVPGLPPGWWTTWAFADGFHPTPAGHRLLAAVVTDALRRAPRPGAS